MTSTTTNTSTERLAAAFAAHQRAKVARPDDRPFNEHTLEQMDSAGLVTMQDKVPALNMAAKAPDSPLAYDMEVARFETEQRVKTTKADKGKIQRRARVARKRQLDAIASSPVRPDAERMQAAWLIVALMLPTITRAANAKRVWASRHLGDVIDDVVGIVTENMALLLAKSDRDLDVLEVAAREIGEQVRRTNQIPGDQLDDDERRERKRISKARKWLMQVVNNRVMDTLVDVYCRSHNLRWENIDILASVMASINGPGSDPMLENWKASRAPAFLGTRFQAPDGIDSNLLAAAINAAITEKGLDRLTEVMLANLNTDGSFPWSEMAEDVIMAMPHGDGPWMWDLITRSTQGVNRDGLAWDMDRARKAHGEIARRYVRSAFEWMPGLILDVIDSFDPKVIGFAASQPGGARAILASDFELFYRPDEPELRLLLEPTLRFGSPEEAARALIEHMAILTTGNDLVRSVAHA